MANETFYIGTGDTSPAIVEQLSDDNGEIDLTGATIRFVVRTKAGVTLIDAVADIASAVTIDGVTTAVDPTDGWVQYDHLDGDTDTPGKHLRKWHVTLGDTSTISVPNDRPGDPYVIST